MKRVSLQVNRRQFLIADFDPRRIGSVIEFGSDFRAGLGRCVRYQIDDDLVAHKRAAAPILGDVAEHPVLDLVPLAGPGRKVAHMNGNLQLDGQLLQVHRSGDIGSPRVAGSTNRSKDSASPGSATVARRRPPPATLSRDPTTASGSSLRAASSAKPLTIVLGDIPIARLTARTPPHP